MLTHDFYLHEKGQYKFLKRFVDYSNNVEKTSFTANYITILNKTNNKKVAYDFASKNKLKLFEMYKNLDMDFNSENKITVSNNCINKTQNAQFYIFSIPKEFKGYSNFRLMYMNEPIQRNSDEGVFMQTNRRLRELTLSN